MKTREKEKWKRMKERKISGKSKNETRKEWKWAKYLKMKQENEGKKNERKT